MWISKEHKKRLVGALKKAKDEYHLVPIDCNRITDAWMAGFFEAEGCVGHNSDEGKRLYMSFTQHDCEAILDEINEKIGQVGHHYDESGQLIIGGRAMIPVINRIEKFLIGKREQILLAKEHLRVIVKRKKKRRTKSDKDYDATMSKKCRALKRRKVE